MLEAINLSKRRDPAAVVYSTNAAALRGKPTIAIESGEAGRTDHESIARIERGIFNILRHLKMVEGEVQPVENPLIVDRDETLRSTATGIFYPTVERNQFLTLLTAKAGGSLDR